jgi:hypothetical protein
MLQLPNYSQASLAFILFNVPQDFVGAGSAELRAESQIRRGVPDRLDLAWEFKVEFLFAWHFAHNTRLIRPLFSFSLPRSCDQVPQSAHSSSEP